MRSAAWYEANSYCRDGERHIGVEVVALNGDCVGHICANCLDSVRRARRGSPLWVAR